MSDPLEERVVATEVIHRGRYLEFRVDTIDRPDGSRATRDVVGHPGAVAVLAIDDEDRLLMVRQWRVPAGGALLETVFPFDLYRGKGVAEGTRSIAYRMRFRAPDRTLTDREVDAAFDRILRRLEEELGVQRRS